MEEVWTEIKLLEEQVQAAENWEVKFEILDKIWRLKLQHGLVRPVSDDYQCEGCSA